MILKMFAFISCIMVLLHSACFRRAIKLRYSEYKGYTLSDGEEEDWPPGTHLHLLKMKLLTLHDFLRVSSFFPPLFIHSKICCSV